MQTFSELKKFLADDIAALDKVIHKSLKSDVVLINQISNYITNSGGKRLRPILLLLITKLFNYNGVAKHTLAAIVEFIHTATLLHDDVVDNANKRRGKQTANEKWGNPASVLTGDFLYSRAFELMVSVNKMAVMAVMAKTTNTIAQGEVMQLLNCQNPQLSSEQYFQVIEYKTACLFKACAELGAIISNANPKEQKALANYGLQLGNAFQIIDDLLDYGIYNSNSGKEVGGDLKEGKTTLPMIYGINSISSDSKKLLISAIKNADNSQIKTIIKILTKAGAFKDTYKAAQKCTQSAKESLQILPNSTTKEALNLLADLCLQRKS